MDNDDIQPLTVTVEQAAKLLGIGRSTAYELIHTGDLPSLRLGRRIVVPVERLGHLLAAAPSPPDGSIRLQPSRSAWS
jgi:excisionase family DNA binding protein